MTEHTELAADVADAVDALGLPSDWGVRAEIRPRRRTLGLELKRSAPTCSCASGATDPTRCATR